MTQVWNVKKVKQDKLTGAKLSLYFKVNQAFACLRFRNVKTPVFIILLRLVCFLRQRILSKIQYPSLQTSLYMFHFKGQAS